jgi:hypothetical protein
MAILDRLLSTQTHGNYSEKQDGDGYVRLPSDLIESLRDHLIVRPPDEYLG